MDEVRAPQEAKWFLGFWIVKGAASPRRVPSKWMLSGQWKTSMWSEIVRARIAEQVQHIKHWSIECRSFDELPNLKATWFVDAPYEGATGRHYRRSRMLDYASLGQWCKSRDGRVIVCESAEADWLPFVALTSTTTMNNRGADLGGRTTAHEAVCILERSH